MIHRQLRTSPRLNRFAAAAFIATCAATSPVSSQADSLRSGIDMSNLNTSVRPQDDFYQYVNGTWLTRTVIPSDKGSYGAFNILQDRTLEQLRAIVDALASQGDLKDADERKIADLYGSFLDEKALQGRGTAPIAAELARIDNLGDKSGLGALFAHLEVIGVNTPVRAGVSQDDKDSAHYAVVLSQGGLGLPDRDYYLQDEARLKSIRDKYPAHIVRLLTDAGMANAQAAAASIIAIETDLAKIQWSRVDNRDPVKTYNRVKVDTLIHGQTDLEWGPLLGELGVATKVPFVIVNQPSYLEALNKVIREHDLDSWKDYLRFRLIASFAPYLESSFVDEAFAFQGTTVQGIPENRPRWKRGLGLVEAGMGEALGRLYVQKHFPAEAKQRMDRLVQNLLAAYREDLDHLDWMGPETRKEALAKLSTFMPKIGYPGKWRDYTALKIDRNDLVGNVIRIARFEQDRDLDKLGKPVDRTEWLMTPQTINAYYNPTMNEIVFPAAILQPPFFDMAADDAVNYGGIGAVIGHEISHGFDDQGSQYGADGNLMNEPGWFTKQDLDRFHVRTKALVAQYSAQEPLPGSHVNGELTLGENIADNSGISIAYQAYQRSLGGTAAPVIDGYTGDQRFFIGWAQVWKNKSRDERTVMLLKVDPHSPPPIRAAIPLKNLTPFHEAFGTKPGDGMYLAPEQRVRIW